MNMFRGNCMKRRLPTQPSCSFSTPLNATSANMYHGLKVSVDRADKSYTSYLTFTGKSCNSGDTPPPPWGNRENIRSGERENNRLGVFSLYTILLIPARGVNTHRASVNSLIKTLSSSYLIFCLALHLGGLGLFASHCIALIRIGLYLVTKYQKSTRPSRCLSLLVVPLPSKTSPSLRLRRLSSPRSNGGLTLECACCTSTPQFFVSVQLPLVTMGKLCQFCDIDR